MRAIYKREMRSYFTGTMGYVFLVLFLTVAGLAFCYTTLFSMSAEVGSFYIIMMIFSAIVSRLPLSQISIIPSALVSYEPYLV